MAGRVPARFFERGADAASRVLADLLSHHAASLDYVVPGGGRSDRRAGRNRLFAAIAVVTLAVVVAVRLGTGGFLCLLLVDYVWNSWHFAAQHAGILRMYPRKSSDARPKLETWGLRRSSFIPACAWRAGRPVGPRICRQQSILSALDIAMTAPVLTLLVAEFTRRPWARPGKVAYLASVAGLYLALLAAVALGKTTLVLSLTTAAAAFHAVEYLAVVTHYAQRRRPKDRAACFAMAGSWSLILASYIVVLGLMANFADAFWPEFWIGINLWAAGLHYAYDGLIWKLRTPQTAAVLNVELPGTTNSSPLPVKASREGNFTARPEPAAVEAI